MLVEMFRCINDGIISPEDIDKVISQGLGLRWAFLGPFEGVDMNSAGGIREYFERFGSMFNGFAADLGQTEPVVTPSAIASLEAYARNMLPLEQIGHRTNWRDSAICALRELKAHNRYVPMSTP